MVAAGRGQAAAWNGECRWVDCRVVHSELEELNSELWELKMRLDFNRLVRCRLLTYLYKVNACFPFGFIFTFACWRKGSLNDLEGTLIG